MIEYIAIFDEGDRYLILDRCFFECAEDAHEYILDNPTICGYKARWYPSDEYYA